MDAFNQRFTRLFLGKFSEIISDSNVMQHAVSNYQSVSSVSGTDRYSGQYTFGLQSWKKSDAEKFTAAYAEALAATIQEIIKTDGFNKSLEIHQATDELNKNVINSITTSINSINPFDELPSQIEQQLKKLSCKEAPAFNYYAFFGGAAIILGAVVVGSALGSPKRSIS